MATATFPRMCLFPFRPRAWTFSSLEPPGDVLYEVVDGRIVELPPMGAYESDIANFLAELLNEHARNESPRSGVCRNALPDRRRPGPQAASGPGVRVGGSVAVSASEFPRAKPGT